VDMWLAFFFFCLCSQSILDFNISFMNTCCICFFPPFNSQILTIIKRRNLNASTPNPVYS
jgi:hypothetical protein